MIVVGKPPRFRRLPHHDAGRGEPVKRLLVLALAVVLAGL